MTKYGLLAPETAAIEKTTLAGYRKVRNLRHLSNADLRMPTPRLMEHQGLSFSTSLMLVKLLDHLDIRDCEHCADLRFAVIAFIRGMVPLSERYQPDEIYTVLVRGHAETHLRPRGTE